MIFKHKAMHFRNYMNEYWVLHSGKCNHKFPIYPQLEIQRYYKDTTLQ